MFQLSDGKSVWRVILLDFDDDCFEVAEFDGVIAVET
jgi:hypothetical protein